MQRPLSLVGRLVGGALAGKLLGFVRELEMARLLGAGMLADGFRGALTAVLLPVNPLQGELMTAGLIPLYREWREEGLGPRLGSALVGGFLLLGLGIMALVMAFAAPWIGLLVAGFAPEAQALTVRLARIMALAIPASILAAALSAIEITLGRSRITMLRMSLQNLGVIIGIAVMAASGQPEAIAWGFACAFHAVALYGAVTLWREGEIALPPMLNPLLVARAAGIFIRRARALLPLPVLEQGNLLLERMLASAAVVGTLASLEYARTLTECALFLVSQPIGYVLLAQAGRQGEALRAQLRGIAAPLLALCIPAALFLVLFAEEIVRLVFQRGAFDEQAVALTSGALTGIGLGLWAATLGWVLIRLLNAGGRNGAAALIIGSAWGANALANLLLVPRYGALGLGLGEAARGLVLLAGTALALGCAGLLLRQLLLALPAIALLLAAGLGLPLLVDGVLPRLLAGGLVFGLVTLAWLLLALPPETRATLRRRLPYLAPPPITPAEGRLDP